jgi:hypothetical protein
VDRLQSFWHVFLESCKGTIRGPPFDMVPPFDNLLLQAQICKASPNSFFCIFVLPLWSTALNFEWIKMMKTMYGLGVYSVKNQI